MKPESHVHQTEVKDLAADLARFYRGSTAYRDHLAEKSDEHYARFVELVVRNAPPGSRVLECGCGAGQASRMMAAAGLNVISSDLSPLFLMEALRRNPERPFTSADVVRLPFPDQTFDVVAGGELIEHLPDIPGALDELARVTRVGGIVILRSPALSSPIWPIIDLPRLLIGHGGRPPHYDTIGQACRFFIRNCRRTARILFGAGEGFERRHPELTPDVAGGDRDAAYWSSPIEVARHFKRLGWRVLQKAEAGARFSPAWLLARCAPWLSPTLALVARREK